MYNHPRQLAIIGPTASGKSALAIRIAKEIDADILSLDSLAIYKEIDIASAKPSYEEMDGVEHYGINLISVDEPFDVTIYMQLYKEIYEQSKAQKRTLIIVGGTSFYLKMLLDGISQTPKLTDDTRKQLEDMLRDISKSYDMLFQIDPQYMSKIARNDRYRIEKALSVYLASDLLPSLYFKKNPPQAIIKDILPIYEISIEKDYLFKRIEKRTEMMLQKGLIEEVYHLKEKYGIEPHCMKAIGIKETLDFLDDKIDQKELVELISIHTRQLAKRQNTFNRTQFKKKISAQNDTIYEKIMGMF
ncbi:MAG: tRNA (adenosine(37)-N6)-dimethylallyltransferase MiaA [Campylobacterales bacterium]|nr:tRNA (adenosine(37)-N6)-dimethylallyltransferase MiaA [Campylobacterales bacterium]